MDASAAPWWLAMIATPTAGAAATAVAYIWKQREKVQAEARQKAAELALQERSERIARLAFLEESLRASEAKRHEDHAAYTLQLLTLLAAAREDAGDLREAILSVKDMPTIVREGMTLNLDGVKLAVIEAVERTSAAPPPPRERQDTQTRKRP